MDWIFDLSIVPYLGLNDACSCLTIIKSQNLKKSHQKSWTWEVFWLKQNGKPFLPLHTISNDSYTFNYTALVLQYILPDFLVPIISVFKDNHHVTSPWFCIHFSLPTSTSFVVCQSLNSTPCLFAFYHFCHLFLS